MQLLPFPRPLRLFLLPLVLLAVAGCGDDDARLGGNIEYMHGMGGARVATNYNQHTQANDSVSYWDGDGVSGAARIEIHLGEQRAYYYKGDQLVAVSQVSTGREGHDTPPGTYHVEGKDLHHRSSLYGDYVDANNPGVVVKDNVENGKDPKPPGSVFLGASMPFYLRSNPAFGMHEGYLPGVPASHGCIRMPGFMAQHFFDNTAVGTPVTISRD